MITKNCSFIMEAQDAAATYFFKAWDWVEKNSKTVIIGAAIAVVAVIVVCYYFYHQNEMEAVAGQALTQFLVSTPPNSDPNQMSDSYLKIANDYPGTQAGNRALMLSAGTLYGAGKYPEAQTQFQKYLDTNPGGPLAGTAALGVAASLDAEGKTSAAAGAYQHVISSYSDVNAVDSAKFALARIDEQAGKLSDAAKLYQDVIRDNANSLLGSEAALRLAQLRSRIPATTNANSPAAPLNPGHP